jgi:hypothetical protein
MPKRVLRRYSPEIRITKRGTFPINKRSKTGQKIVLYGAAFKLAWEQVPTFQRSKQPNISLQLHASILRQLKSGATDPHGIAVEALKDVRESSKLDAR